MISFSCSISNKITEPWKDVNGVDWFGTSPTKDIIHVGSAHAVTLCGADKYQELSFGNTEFLILNFPEDSGLGQNLKNLLDINFVVFEGLAVKQDVVNEGYTNDI